MISVEQALDIILQNKYPSATETVCVEAALGRVLREPLCADRDFPPFDRVTMDGIAFRMDDFEKGQRAFPIQGIAAAGNPQLTLQSPCTCIEVMTGAMLPKGTDAVVRYEDLHIQDGTATINMDVVKFRQNIHSQGTDRKKGELLIPIGRRIGAAEIGTAATIGKSELLVSKPPRTAVIASGDELVGIREQPLEHQIRTSNVYSVNALLKEEGICGDIFHFMDDEEQIREGLVKILDEYELIVLSGAVSAGKFDFFPKILSELGVKKHFHQVSQRPGKPFWFGKSHKGCTVFALPGNPVSTFLNACKYLKPWVKASIGSAPISPSFVVLDKEVVFKPDLTYFVPVKIENRQGTLYALPLEGSGSGDLANLNDAHGFIELPKGKQVYEKGEVFPLV